MALKEMMKICGEVRKQWAVTKVVILHRIVRYYNMYFFVFYFSFGVGEMGDGNSRNCSVYSPLYAYLCNSDACRRASIIQTNKRTKGVCPIQEASVIIAISSPHRKEALEAVSYAIDTLKVKVPIWKKEVYDEGQGAPVWKANKLP